MPKNATRTRFEGVFAIESTKRRHEGKPDVCYYYVIKVEGKRKWYKAGWRSEGYTATVAHELRSQHVQGLRHGTALPAKKNKGGGVSFDAAWEAYNTRALTELASAEMVRRNVRLHLLPTFGGQSLSSITPLDVEVLKQRLQESNLSPQTIVHILGHLNRIFMQTAAWGMHELPSPLQGVKRPKIDNARTRYLTRAEAGRLLTALLRRSHLWHDIAALSLTTGARLTEIRTLVRGRVDLSGGVMEVDGKTGRRMVQLSDVAKDILHPRLTGSKESFVFESANGTVVDITANSFRRAVIACDFNPPGTPREHKVVFHTLRHTFASWLAIDGVPLLVIAELMGHKTLEMTKRYSHLCPDQKRQVVNVIGQSLHDVIPSF